MKEIDGCDRPVEAVTEVELSADDLLDLSPAQAPVPGEAMQRSVAAPADRSDGVAEPEEEERIPTRDRRWSVTWIVAALGLPAAAAALVVAQYESPPAGHVNEAVSAAATAPLEAPAPTPAPDPALPPVKFANPFDKSEVFEFPPGTSREEARAAVAEILMNRAHERQGLVDSGTAQRR